MIAFVIPQLSGGGSERVVVTLANTISRSRKRVTIFSVFRDTPAYIINQAVEVVYLTSSHLSDITSAPHLLWIYLLAACRFSFYSS